jgi:hypothetical protein
MAEKRAQLEIQKLRLANRVTENGSATSTSKPDTSVIDRQVDAIKENSKRIAELTKVMTAEPFDATTMIYDTIGSMMGNKVLIKPLMVDQETPTGKDPVYNMANLIPGYGITDAFTVIEKITDGWKQIENALTSSTKSISELTSNIASAENELTSVMKLDKSDKRDIRIKELNKEIDKLWADLDVAEITHKKNVAADKTIQSQKKKYDESKLVHDIGAVQVSKMMEKSQETVKQLMADLSIDIEKDISEKKYSLFDAIFGKNAKEDMNAKFKSYKDALMDAVLSGLSEERLAKELIDLPPDMVEMVKNMYTQVYTGAIDKVINPIATKAVKSLNDTIAQSINNGIGKVFKDIQEFVTPLWDGFTDAMNSFEALDTMYHDQKMQRIQEEFDLRVKMEEEILAQTVMSDRARIKAEKRLAKEQEKNQEAIEERERQFKEKQKIWAIAQATINGALAITDIWASHASNPIYAGVLTGLAVANTGAQVAMIAAQKLFDGGVVGDKFNGATYGKDNTVVQARDGEIMINAPQQRRLWDFISGKTMGNSGGTYAPQVAFHVTGVDAKSMKALKKNQQEFLKDLENGYRELKRYGRI